MSDDRLTVDEVAAALVDLAGAFSRLGVSFEQASKHMNELVAAVSCECGCTCENGVRAVIETFDGTRYNIRCRCLCDHCRGPLKRPGAKLV